MISGIFFGVLLTIISYFIRRKTLHNPEMVCPNCGEIFRSDADRVQIEYNLGSDAEYFVFLCKRCMKSPDSLNLERIINFFRMTKKDPEEIKEISDAIEDLAWSQ